MAIDFPAKSIKCHHCGCNLDCNSNAQKYCAIDDNPFCYDSRVTSKMSDRQYAKYRGVPYSYLKEKLKSKQP